MEALLKIPFSEKDTAKDIAKGYGCRLFFDGASKLWNFTGPMLPKELAEYVVPGSVSEDNAPAPVPHKTQFSFLNPKTAPAPIVPSKPYYNYVLDIPFSHRNDMSRVGAYYHSLFKTYVVKTRDTAHLPHLWRAFPYSYEAWIEKFLNNKTVSPDILALFPEETLITARDYQEKAKDMAYAAYDAGLGGFLIADEVGLGKTISAAIVALDKGDFKTVLVVTTLSATAHWRKTFLKYKIKDKEILVINYDRLQKLFRPDEDTLAARKAKKTVSRKRKNKAVAKKFLVPVFDLVVWDESHKLKNNTSTRSKLAMKIQVQAKFNLYLSATAGQNPLELSYLAPLLARITGDSVKNMDDFEQWCISQDLGVTRGKYGAWKWDGTENKEAVQKMHRLLFEGAIPGAVRRTPQDIAGWPEISRILQPYDMDTEEAENYDLAWHEFCAAYQKIKLVSPKEAARVRQNEQLRFRQKSSLLKVPYVVEQTQELLEQGHSVAISVGFKQTLFELETKLTKAGVKVVKIFGEQSAHEKEENRMQFQKDEAQVMIFTVEEAISLHQGEYPEGLRPRSMIVNDLRWSAISMAQIEGRTHRDGKFSQIYWAFFDNTVDGKIAQIVLSRLISMKTMIGDDQKTLDEIETLLLSLSEKEEALI